MNGPRQRKPGWWYPYIFVGGFAVVIAVNGALLYFATSTFTGLETESAYEKGLAYNQALAAAQEQEKLGWQADVAVLADKAGGGGRRLVVDFRNRDGGPVTGLRVFAVVSRPTQAGLDQRVELSPDPDGGRYGADLSLPLPGQWDVQVVAQQGDVNWQTSKRLVIP